MIWHDDFKMSFFECHKWQQTGHIKKKQSNATLQRKIRAYIVIKLMAFS